MPSRVVPLSLHVDYWDYIGWKDPCAKPAFSGRQRKLTQLQRLDKDHLKDAALYVAAYENRLAGLVTSGENLGHTLKHDFVVLEWLGPLDFGPGGDRAERRGVPLLPRAVAANSGVAAFVQNRRSLEVLQALMLPACEQGKKRGQGQGKG